MTTEITREKLSKYLEEKATEHNIEIESASELTHLPDHALNSEIIKIKATDEFLNRVNIMPVTTEFGNTLGLGSGQLIASRADTANGIGREPVSAHNGESMPAICVQINFDTYVTYNTLNTYSLMDNFQELLDNEMSYQSTQDIARVGFHGETSKAQSDRDTYPNGEDLAQGWFQALREFKPESIISSGKAENEVRLLHPDGDYLTITDAVRAVKNKLPLIYRNVNDLVVLIGSELVDMDGKQYYRDYNDSNGKDKKSKMRQVEGGYVGLPAFTPSNFPPFGVFITSFDNLSIYMLKSTLRRNHAKNNPSEDRIETFTSVKMCYVIEQLSKSAALDFKNVKFMSNNN